jgi:hypothetical protein
VIRKTIVLARNELEQIWKLILINTFVLGPCKYALITPRTTAMRHNPATSCSKCPCQRKKMKRAFVLR